MAGLALRAQGPGPGSESFLADAGLEHTAVHGVAFEPDGKLWLASPNGLLGYDGVNWSRLAAADGLPSSSITTVVWCGGELWVGTDRGAGYLRAGRFVAAGPVVDRRVRRLAVAGADDLWLCSADGTYRRRDGVWERMFPGEQIVDAAMLGDGSLLLVAEGKLLRVAADTTTELTPPPGFDLIVPTSAAVDEHGALVVVVGDTLWRHADASPAVPWRTVGTPQRRQTCAVTRSRDRRLVAFATGAHRYFTVSELSFQPLSADAPSAGGIVHGLIEAPDGGLWAYGDDLLRRLQPPSDRRIDLPMPRLADADGRIWFGDAQSVVWLLGSESVAAPDLALPFAAGSNFMVACSRKGAGTVVLRDELELPAELPFRRGRLRLLVDGADVAWACSVGRKVGLAWLDAELRWQRCAIEDSLADDLAGSTVSADPHDGVWLATIGTARPLVRVAARRPLEQVPTPEPLACGDVAVDGQDRLWVVGNSGPWTSTASAGWQPYGDRWTLSVSWLRSVGGRVVLGCSHGRDGGSGLVVVEGERATTLPSALPRVLGQDARGLYVAAGGAVYLVAPTGPVTVLGGVDARDVESIVVDRDLRAWLGHRNNTVSVLDLPEPTLFVESRTTNPIAGEPIDLQVRVAFRFVSGERVSHPSASLSWSTDGGPWTVPAALANRIRLADLAPGSHSVEFRARDALGRLALRTLRLDVRARPLQEQPWFPIALAGVGVLVSALAAFALAASRRLMRQTTQLRAAVERRTSKIRNELFRRRRAERHVRHQHRVLGLLATGKPIEQALAALLSGLEEQLPRWRGAICLVEGERLTLVAGPELSAAERAFLDGRPLAAGCPCARAALEVRTVLEDAKSSFWRDVAGSLDLSSICAQPILSTTGRVLGVLVLLRDVDGKLTPDQSELVEAAAHIAAVAIDSKRTEAERFELQQQVLDAQKLRSLGLLAGGIAHDFNNLLTGVLGYAGLARMQSIAGSPADEALAQVEMATERAAELCAQLLAYSGRGRVVVKPVAVSALVREMVQMLRLPVSRNVTLELDLAAELPAVEADATQLRQVVMNLITNAAEAVGDTAGRVGVRTGVVELDAERLRHAVVGRGAAPGRYVFVEVADTGCGMSEATRRSMFEPFFTTKASGRGLGMAAVHGIVQGHRGAIELESQPGRGTTIRVLLPASALAPDTTRVVVAGPDLHETGAVLVAEDDAVVRSLAEKVLAGIGFEVAVVADGAAAARLVEEGRHDFRLALLDIVMPRLTGFEVLERLRRTDPDLPVILASGNEMADTSVTASDAHTHFLPKPYGSQALLQAVRRALGNRHVARGNPARRASRSSADG